MCRELFVNWKWYEKTFHDKYGVHISEKTSLQHCSMYNESSNRKSTLNYFISVAIMEYMTNEDLFVSESKDVTLAQRNSTLVAYFKASGEIYACVKANETFFSQYILKEENRKGTDIFLSLLPTAIEDNEFEANYTKLKLLYEKNVHDKNILSESTFVESFTTALFILNDNLYRRLLNGEIKADIPISGIRLLKYHMLSKESFSYFKRDILREFETDFIEIGVVAPAVSHENHLSAYILDESRVLSEQEVNMIPILKDWFLIPKEAETICQHAKMTTNTNMVMRNFMLSGPSGTGKTESARAIANGLGLPYLYFTCSANTEITDLIGQILPDMDKKLHVSTLPTLEDIVFAPSLAYEILTGEKTSNISSQKVFVLYKEEIEKREKQKSDKQSYSFVYSPIIEAIKNGWVVELQEPTVISNPGVLAGLNGLLDGGGI